MLFRRCRCRCRRLCRCSNRLYCFNPPIVAMSLQSMLRWPVYTRTSHKRRFPDPPSHLPPLEKKRKEKKNRFPKMVTRVSFLKTPAYRFRVKGQKRRFSTMMSYIIQRMPREGCYCIFIFLAFGVDGRKGFRSNMLRLDSYFFENKGKILRVEKYGDTCARVASHAEFVTRSFPIA